jgi:uncharacterized protein (TIGR03083 family)
VEAHALVDGIRIEGTAFIAAIRECRDRLDTQVPSCPEWTLADLAAHVGTFVCQFLGEAPGGDPAPGWWSGVPSPADRADWLASRFSELHDRFAALLDLGDDGVAFAAPRLGHARRVAHEVAIHRWDAELAATGRPNPIDDARALDGIAEAREVFGAPEPPATGSASDRFLRLAGRPT